MDAKTSDMESTGGFEKTEKAGRRSRVSGIDRALQVLDYLYETGTPAGVYAIAKAIGAPLSTVYVIIDDLVEKNLLTRNSDSSVWLGARLYHYGLAYARSLDFLNVANHEMHNLSRVSGETVQVCGRDGDHMLVLAMADGPGHFQVTSRVGTRVPLNWTASGRLLVGHLSDKERLDLFEHCAKSSPTGRAEIDPAVLSEAAQQALQARISIQAGEVRLRRCMRCLAHLRRQGCLHRDDFHRSSRAENCRPSRALHCRSEGFGGTDRDGDGLAQSFVSSILQGNDCLDLHSDVARQRTEAHGGTCVVSCFTENIDEQVGTTIDD